MTHMTAFVARPVQGKYVACCSSLDCYLSNSTLKSNANNHHHLLDMKVGMNTNVQSICSASDRKITASTSLNLQ